VGETRRHTTVLDETTETQQKRNILQFGCSVVHLGRFKHNWVRQLAFALSYGKINLNNISIQKYLYVYKL